MIGRVETAQLLVKPKLRGVFHELGFYASAAVGVAVAADASEDRTAEKEDAVVFLDGLGRDAAPAPEAMRDVVVLTEELEIERVLVEGRARVVG